MLGGVVPVDRPVMAESVPYAVLDVGLKCPVSTTRESEWELAKFRWRHQQSHHIGHFNQYYIVYTLCFTGYYIDNNAHFYGIVVSAGGRVSS